MLNDDISLSLSLSYKWDKKAYHKFKHNECDCMVKATTLNFINFSLWNCCVHEYVYANLQVTSLWPRKLVCPMESF